jgi:diguanylate cyclase (GGDEF)-like protein/PAS domain S-box-containing protein
VPRRVGRTASEGWRQIALRHAAIFACAAAATGAGLLLLGIDPRTPRPAHPDTAAFLALALAVGISAILDPRRPSSEDQAALRLSFVTSLGALLLFGPAAMIFVATISTVARAGRGSFQPQGIRCLVIETATVAAGAQAAALVHGAVGGTGTPLIWPWQGVSIAAVVSAYSLVTSAITDGLVPLALRTPPRRSWPGHALRGCPSHFVGAAVSVALVEAIAYQAWGAVAVGALPMYFAWRAYVTHEGQDARQSRRFDMASGSDHGVALVNERGEITFWNDVLAALVQCPRDRAIGRTVAQAVPALAQSDLPGTIQKALMAGKLRILPHVAVRLSSGVRLLSITILSEPDGAMLVWRDVTDEAQLEQSLRQAAERFALVAEGANDGLWELDLRNQTLYRSARWKAIVGLPPGAGIGAPDEWFNRVHADDLPALKQALATQGSGQTAHVQHEHRIRHEDGTYRRVLCRGVGVRDQANRTFRLAGSLTDITENAAAQERILNAGLRDSLTGLGNRAAFVEALGRRLDDFKAHRGGRFAALYLDLDRFKVVNDSLGHLIGDELLVAVSRRLEKCLRPGDIIARLGGDEFAILLHGLTDETQANVVAFRIQETLGKAFSIGGREVVTSASIGIAFSRTDYASPEAIMRDADTAMYHAKAHGKARHELFDADMHARTIDRLGLESDLRHAVRNGDFEVHYQPIVSLSSRMCTGFESLIRWKRNGQAVSPADFIPVAEELGLIEQLGAEVLQEACRTFAGWQRRFADCGLDCLTVNVSTRQLVQQGFMYLVEQTVHSTGMKPCDLRLEITETALMDAPRQTAQVLQELRDFGVKIYLDDFGTGYSSLSHLHKLPVDALKIDRSFVRNLLIEDRPAIVESILALAKTLHTEVVAEGVEEELQAQKLERLGCRRAQGYYFSRALSARAAEELLAARQPLGVKPADGPDMSAANSKEPVPFVLRGRADRPSQPVIRGVAV